MHRTAQQFVHSEYSGMQRTSLYSTVYTYKGIKDRSCLNAQVWEHGGNRISRSCCTKSIEAVLLFGDRVFYRSGHDQNRWIRSSSCHCCLRRQQPSRWEMTAQNPPTRKQDPGLWTFGTYLAVGDPKLWVKRLEKLWYLQRMLPELLSWKVPCASCCIRFSIAVKPAEMKGCLVDYESMPKVHWPSASLKAPVASFRFENKNA